MGQCNEYIHSKLWNIFLSFSVSFVPGYTVAYQQGKKSCSFDYVISIHNDFNLKRCKELCDADEDCIFFFFNVDLACIAYESCHDYSVTKVAGQTFRKITEITGNLCVLQQSEHCNK